MMLDCQPPTSSYNGYFSWRFYSSVTGELIYSQPPFSLNADHFPASRYRQLDQYGLEISSVDWKDGGVYGCEFLTENKLSLFHVIVIGQLLLLLLLNDLTLFT